MSKLGNTHLRSDLREHGEITASITNIQTTTLAAQTIQLDTSFVDSVAEGRLQWNSEDGTMEYGLPGGTVNLQVGQEVVLKGVNKTATDIPNGAVIRITGAQGSRPKVAPARSDSPYTTGAAGMATEDILVNNTGYITLMGLVRDIDTSDWPAGTLLYLSPDRWGGMTATRPTAPNYKIFVAYCLFSSAESGVVTTNTSFIPTMMSLSDVKEAAPSVDGQFVSWVDSNNRFELASKAYVGNAASNVTIDKTKGVRLNGIEAWDDLRFPVNAVIINPLTSKPDTITFIGNTRVLGFDNTASESVTFSAQMPHSWLQESEVEAHVHWAPTDDSAGNVRWVFEYTWANIGSTFPALATFGGTSAAASQNAHIYADLGELNSSGKTVSSMMMCRLIRDVAASGDTYAADAALLEVDFHYRLDGFGSEAETTKA